MRQQSRTKQISVKYKGRTLFQTPLLAIRQTLDECFEILKAHCAVEVANNGQ